MRFVNVIPAPYGKPAFPANVFEQAVGELFNKDLSPLFRGNGFSKIPAVNVVETADNYRLEVAAPGFSKEDFSVTADQDLLTISAKKESKTEETGKVTRREFSFEEFKRSFVLPDSVDAASISASYENGVLNVVLAKKAEAKPVPVRTIEIN